MDHLSQSGAGIFRDCRKFAQLRYERNIRPLEEDNVLSLGKLVHKALELNYLGRIARAGPEWRTMLRDELNNEKPKYPSYVDITQIIMERYAEKYCTVDLAYEVVAVEKEFDLPLINPETGAASRSFRRTGKIDMVVRKISDGTYWLVEHKSAGRIDAGYLSRLWLDFQITWYVDAAAEVLGIPIHGVIYNMIEKPATAKLVPSIGETEAEFELRKAELKNPKAAKRKMPETNSEFIERIEKFYDDPTVFSREEIILCQEDVATMRQEAWDIGQAWLDARLNDRWYRNTSHCFKWNKPCCMLPICQSRENPLIIEAKYKIEKPEEPKPPAPF